VVSKVVTEASPLAEQRAIDAVVVGASAGAVSALGVILPKLAPDFAPAVIVVVHLQPHVPSLLTQIFQDRCALAVREPMDKDAVARGTVWFAPPDYHLLIERNWVFALSIAPPVHFSRPSIDVLFESAAEAYGERLAGVVLTGAGYDGVAGARAIRDNGGLVLVQDPETAEAPLLPTMTLKAGVAHQVSDLPEIDDTLNQLGRHCA
jgi:two-component system chemotaxis response regulator CheB